jgi:hypothetical protein
MVTTPAHFASPHFAFGASKCGGASRLPFAGLSGISPSLPARTHVIPAEMINPSPGISAMVPSTSIGSCISTRTLRSMKNPTPSKHQHNADLQRRQHARNRIGHALLLLKAHRNRRSLQGSACRPRSPCSPPVPGWTELVDQAAVHFALQLEDAPPAPVLKELPHQPHQRARKQANASSEAIG